ncbi:MAG TPA: sigma-70 family RNA polymerase sigma factor [Vicinamibacterales bacterium]|jgi:RNA polymerase sigma-70 factor (ECF subfamily)|nr:sigma-70 family RNA polymerase sigma factor [Vicinamibacterales bacterium]
MDAQERLEVEAAQKDPSKFADLYERHFEAVYAFVIRRVRVRAMAEDVTADVFRRALSALPRYQFIGAPFRAWLFRIGANVIADLAKRANREVPVADDLPELSVEAEGHRDEYRSDHHADLFRFVSELPVDQHRVIIGRFVDEESIREIASRLNKTEGAVKQLQFRALQSLRKRMDARRDGQEGVDG